MTVSLNFFVTVFVMVLTKIWNLKRHKKGIIITSLYCVKESFILCPHILVYCLHFNSASLLVFITEGNIIIFPTKIRKKKDFEQLLRGKRKRDSNESRQDTNLFLLSCSSKALCLFDGDFT